MKLDFRIDWGYQYLYSRRHYHPVYHWDGHLECTDGVISECRRLDYPVIWYGPGQCAHETPLDKAEWQSTTKRGLAGIRVIAEVAENSVFTLHTASGNFEFSAAEILADGRIVFPVGPKYLNCHVVVTRTGYLWFRPEPAPGETVIEADQLALEVRDWARMRTAWLAPGATVEFPVTIPASGADHAETVFHLIAMAAAEYTPGAEKQIHDEFPLALACDGQPPVTFKHYFRNHDNFMQMLEDVWVRVALTPGPHRLTLTNNHPKFSLLISRITLRPSEHMHGELSLPAWALVGEPLIGRVFAVRPDTVTVCWPDGEKTLELQPGWNEFDFALSSPGVAVAVRTATTASTVGVVYALPEETPPVTVGYDMTVVPHDANGFMDWLLDYTERTRLGNLVVFRSFLFENPESRTMRPVDGALLRKWGEFCRRHHIHVEAATDFDDGNLVAGAQAMLHSVGRHEWPGAVYARDPAPPWQSGDMREAMEHYLSYLKIEIDRAHRVAPRAAFGDASGGHRYCYLAGAEFIRTETMVPHTQHLCSQARPAAEALGDGEWGVHIAIQHPVQPYFENHLAMYYLSLFQPWMMGASMIYEEDCLFQLFKEERQAWDDRLTKGKRDMTRDFFRFAKTHPRTGRCVRRIAFLEGRYAAPFNGFICDSEQDPSYSVWGYFGNPDPAWGHGQPEKCRQLLDVLMPGASTQPLRQRFDKRRFFFSGTPYGDFDETPIEAATDYFQQYRLLLNLGWHTMLAEDHAKLTDFVRAGGTLFTGIPQFSTHVKRDFLKDFNDLALWRDGDLSELAGIRVLGRGHDYSGQWNAAWRESFVEPELSGLPNNASEEDGAPMLAKIELAGAEVVAWDAASGDPLVVRHRVGAGWVYTLTAWAYPGHEKFQGVAASWLAKLAAEARDDIYVTDESREVFWTLWRDGAVATLMLLNTDWSSAGNVKTVTVTTPEFDFELDVRQDEARLITIFGDWAVAVPTDAHLENRGAGKFRLHGCGDTVLEFFHADGTNEAVTVDFDGKSMVDIEL